jgi:hypothetical protein
MNKEKYNMDPMNYNLQNKLPINHPFYVNNQIATIICSTILNNLNCILRH